MEDVGGVGGGGGGWVDEGWEWGGGEWVRKAEMVVAVNGDTLV